MISAGKEQFRKYTEQKTERPVHFLKVAPISPVISNNNNNKQGSIPYSIKMIMSFVHQNGVKEYFHTLRINRSIYTVCWNISCTTILEGSLRLSHKSSKNQKRHF